MEDKKALRKKYSEIRKNAKSDGKDIQIGLRLLKNEKILSADNILLYASFGSEVDTWAILCCLSRPAFGKPKISTAYPKCHENGIMTFHIINSVKDFEKGRYDIYEPCGDLPQPVITEKTVCIVPGLAFTEKGGRLGYGGGYYDRFISANPQLYTIALAYEATITESLPLMPHDIFVDSIVTEERTIICNE